MEEISKWSDRIYWLSYHKDEVACFNCSRCGKAKNYNVDSMLDVLGDIAVPSLPDVVSKAVGCPYFANTGWNRCRMQPAWKAFRPKAAPKPGPITLPKGMYEFEDITIGQINEWQLVYCVCRCGYLANLDRKQMLRRFGADRRLYDLAGRMRCRRCTNRKGNVFGFRMMER